MRENAKEVRMDYELGCDRLSNLPLGMIHAILARVPIQDVVRTSILSRQWRYTWASLPQLDFKKTRDFTIDQTIYEKRLIRFVTRTLLHHEGPIHMFKISYFIENIGPKIDRWVHCLSRNDIRELIMDFGKLRESEELGDQLHLHSSIYFCENLTYLRLCRCKFDPPPPTFKGFMFLRSLFLRDINLSPDELKSLVASCPLLERLELVMELERELKISALNLKCLHLCGGYGQMSVYAPLLAEIEVELSNCIIFDISEEEESSLRYYTNFFGGFTNLEKLVGYEYFTKFLSIGIKYCSHSIILCHLKVIHLQGVNPEDFYEIVAVGRLIMGAPNLYKLDIFLETTSFELEDNNVCIRDFLSARDFSFEKLRFVRFKGLNALFIEKELIKFLLKSSPALETMRLRYCSLGTDEVQSVVDDLLGCRKASPSARISIVDGF